MAAAQKPGERDWEAAACKLQLQIVDLSSQCLATKRVFEILAEQDFQFFSVITGRWLEFFHEEKTRQMVILENSVGSSAAAECDSGRRTPEMDCLTLKSI